MTALFFTKFFLCQGQQKCCHRQNRSNQINFDATYLTTIPIWDRISKMMK